MESFFLEFVKRPFVTGAVSPSSNALTEAILSRADLKRGRSVVELGSGDGVLTEKIARRISSGTSFVALELNPDLVRRSRERCPGVEVYEDSAANLKKYLKKKGSSYDRIISTLPWSTFKSSLQDVILKNIYSSLEDGGLFLTISYKHSLLLPGGQRFKRLLSKTFSEVKRSPIVWKNVPPAFVYACRK